jgi:hypothetical protein
MQRTIMTAAVSLTLVAGGLLHGFWTQRWSSLDQPAIDAASAKLERVPLLVGDWTGRFIPLEQDPFPEEVIGRNVAIQYVNRDNGQVVIVYLACGASTHLIQHTPLQCYPAHGYKLAGQECRFQVPEVELPGLPEFWAATFTQEQNPAQLHLRVFWAWKDASRWQVPGNPGRAFRGAAYLYKLYLVRQIASLEEPLAGDPTAAFMKVFLPELDRALGQ